jgi:hypothetical protein
MSSPDAARARNAYPAAWSSRYGTAVNAKAAASAAQRMPAVEGLMRTAVEAMAQMKPNAENAAAAT